MTTLETRRLAKWREELELNRFGFEPELCRAIIRQLEDLMGLPRAEGGETKLRESTLTC